MFVISDQGVGNETAELGRAPSGLVHEQRPAWVLPGLAMSIVGWLVIAGSITLLFVGHWATVVGVVLLVIFGALLGGVFVVQPNEARVLLLFGRYVGSVPQARLGGC